MGVFSEMASFNVPCPGAVGDAGCPFVGSGATLSTARRAVRGHVLRRHGARFEGEGLPLRPLPPQELERHLAAFRRSQLSAVQRRASLAALLGDLDAVAGGDGSAAGSVSGRTAGVGCLLGDPFSWFGGVLPDLSPGQLPCEQPSAGPSGPASVSVAVQAAFQPPAGLDAQRMAEYVWRPANRSCFPSTLSARLQRRESLPDPLLLYVLEVAAHLRRMIGRELETGVVDSLQVDPSGGTAYQRAVESVRVLAGAPLEEELRAAHE